MNSLTRLMITFAGLSSLSFAQLVIPSGSKVTCRLDQAISSATAQEGQAVNLSVTEDIRINDVVVIKQGSTVYGAITQAQEKRRMGRAGKLDFSIDKVRAADGEFIPLRYTPFKKNGDGRGVTTGVLTAGAAIVFWPAAPLFLLMKGKDVTIQKGITIDVFTDADHTMKSPAYREAPVITSLAPGAAAPAMSMANPAGNPFHGGTGAELVPVTIEADVEGAEVEVDGAYVGNAPSTRRLAPGSHTVTVREGALVWERTLNVQAGDNLRVRAKLNQVGPPPPAAPARTALRNR